ncbi:hypothetical protein QWA_17890, partial [Alcaligenes faecalis subsp. faecalis NCIB 8687]
VVQFVGDGTYGATANTAMGTPLWIPQFLWVGGLIWLCVVLALMLLRSRLALITGDLAGIRSLITGDLAGIRSLCGIRSTQEEASEEAEAGKRMVQGDAK